MGYRAILALSALRYGPSGLLRAGPSIRTSCYSGQAVDLQEATSKPGIRVAEYCLVISQWHRLL